MRKPLVCKFCGTPIVMIKTDRNHTTPCDVIVLRDELSQMLLEQTAASKGIALDDTAANVIYEPHKLTCTNYKGKGGRSK